MGSAAPHHDHLDDDAVLDPAESLALLRAEQSRAARSFAVDTALLYAAWGLAWAVGFTAFALHGGPDPVVAWSPVVPGLVLFAGLVGAGVLTAVHTAHRTRGITGPSELAGALYGWAWSIAFVALALLVNATAAALGDDRVHAVLWPAGSGLVVGLLYLMGGALWRDRTQYALGAWLALTSCAAPFLAAPGQHWVMAVAGGGGFLVAAAVEGLRRGSGGTPA